MIINHLSLPPVKSLQSNHSRPSQITQSKDRAHHPPMTISFPLVSHKNTNSVLPTLTSPITNAV